MTPRPLTVAVVGATGVVGRTMIQVLHERSFPLGELRLMASSRSAGSTVSVAGTHPRRRSRPSPDAFDGVDIALFSAGADISRGPRAGRRSPMARRSSTTRAPGGWTPGVPLVVSQVNADDAAAHEGIVANPNCSTMQLVPVLMALRDSVGIERVVVDTYQSVSGTGAEAIAELEGQIRAHVAGEPLTRLGLPAPDRVQRRCPRSTSSSTTATRGRSGRSSPRAARSSTCPTCGSRARPSGSRCSPATPRPSTSRPVTRSRRNARASCSRPCPGVVVQDDPAGHVYPLAIEAAGHDEIFVGRVRRDPSIAGRPRARPVGRQRQPAQGRGDERRRDRRDPRPRRGWVRPRRRPGRRRECGVTDSERGAALEAIAAEIRECTRCRLHEQRARAVPGEGSPDTEVVFVGEGPGRDENQAGRPVRGRLGPIC